MLSAKPLCSIVLLPFSAILTDLILFFMHPTHTGLLFAVKTFYNLSLPIQCHSVVLCAWCDIHEVVVLHYDPWVIVLHLHDFCGFSVFVM